MITVTEKAAAKLKELIAEDKKEFLRVAVKGGGCSGFQYHMELTSEKDENDSVYEPNGVKVIIDPISIRYLLGSEIDYSEEVVGGKFTIKNPGAKSTCGCGD